MHALRKVLRRAPVGRARPSVGRARPSVGRAMSHIVVAFGVEMEAADQIKQLWQAGQLPY